MPHKEQTITPAQEALLQFVSPLEADAIFQQIHITLIVSLRPGEQEPSPTTIEAWYYTLQLMGLIHNIAVERGSATLT